MTKMKNDKIEEIAGMLKCDLDITKEDKELQKIYKQLENGENSRPSNGTIGGVEIEFYIYHTVEYVLENVLDEINNKKVDSKKIIKIVYEKVKDTYNNSDEALTGEDEMEIVEILIAELKHPKYDLDKIEIDGAY